MDLQPGEVISHFVNQLPKINLWDLIGGIGKKTQCSKKIMVFCTIY